jgi:hypothetical protein
MSDSATSFPGGPRDLFHDLLGSAANSIAQVWLGATRFCGADRQPCRGSLFQFHDKDLVISVLYILDLMLRAASPHYVASFASNVFLFFALGPYDATLVKVDDQPIMPGNGWMSLTPRVVDS